MKSMISIFAMLLLPLGLLAQSSFKVSDNSTFKITGTSTVHDWTMQAQGVQGEAEIVLASGKLTDIKTLKLILPAEGLKSGKSAMDKNAYDALRTEKYPNIYFRLGNINAIEQKGHEVSIRASGVLTVAGFSKPEQIEAKGRIDQNGAICLIGNKKIKMSRYGIEPPSFMFGSVSTGDELNVHFELILSPDSLLQ